MAVINTIAVVLPIAIPSFFKINRAIADPPTTEGVTDEANSHNMITWKLLRQES